MAKNQKPVSVERAFAALGKLQKRTPEQWELAASLWPGMAKTWRPLGDFVRGEYTPQFDGDYIEELTERYRWARREHHKKSGRAASTLDSRSDRKIVISIARLFYLEKVAEEVCKDGPKKPEQRALYAVVAEFGVAEKTARNSWFKVKKPNTPA